MTNPYAPPDAELGDGDPPGPSDGAPRYAGFWRRFGALWIDTLVASPLIAINLFGGNASRQFALYWFVPGLLFGVFYNVWVVRRWGGTVGNLVMSTRITRPDGSRITVANALRRYSIAMLLGALVALALVLASLSVTDEAYFSVGFVQRSQLLVSSTPVWYQPVSLLLQIWIWSEFVTMFFNKRRRAFQDLVGGTVVVHRPSTHQAWTA
ncbi:hypothetical protein BH10PSE17_BH10PSE17_19500 [soil metagenome]